MAVCLYKFIYIHHIFHSNATVLFTAHSHSDGNVTYVIYTFGHVVEGRIDIMSEKYKDDNMTYLSYLQFGCVGIRLKQVVILDKMQNNTTETSLIYKMQRIHFS